MIARVVIDASVAVKWFVPEERSGVADALSDSGAVLLAPLLLKLEVANALRKKIGAGLVRVEDALDFIDALPRYFDRQIDHDDFLVEALRLGASIGHPLYDCIYLVMARRHDATLVTDDAAFLKRVGQHGLDGAVALSDWESVFR